MISLWDGKGRSYMQALHFCLGFGGIMSPIATEPFLAKPVCKSTLGNSTQSGKQLTLNGLTLSMYGIRNDFQTIQICTHKVVQY